MFTVWCFFFVAFGRTLWIDWNVSWFIVSRSVPFSTVTAPRWLGWFVVVPAMVRSAITITTVAIFARALLLSVATTTVMGLLLLVPRSRGSWVLRVNWISGPASASTSVFVMGSALFSVRWCFFPFPWGSASGAAFWARQMDFVRLIGDLGSGVFITTFDFGAAFVMATITALGLWLWFVVSAILIGFLVMRWSYQVIGAFVAPHIDIIVILILIVISSRRIRRPIPTHVGRMLLIVHIVRKTSMSWHRVARQHTGSPMVV